MIGGDCVRYIFSFVPTFNLAFSFIGLSQTQTFNNLCINNIDKTTLTQVCTEFYNAANTGQEIDDLRSKVAYLQCCEMKYVDDEKLDLCDHKPYVEFAGGFGKCHEIKSFFTWDKLNGLNTNFLFMFGTSLLFIVILVLIETGVIKRILTGKGGNRGFVESNLDGDVVQERQRTLALMDDRKQKSDVFLVSNLCKEFGVGKKFLAVDHLTFGVKHGECFGLLGVNGAGKTTSFRYKTNSFLAIFKEIMNIIFVKRMLTGDELMTSGSASLLGNNILNNRSGYLSKIGYCPQFDSIIDVMTGREMLELFARLRGMRPSEIPGEVNYWLEEIGITQYADRKCGTYSGGNKRKLNVAQALVADPPIIFMDEPSSGVDPASRRKLWKIIKDVQKKGQSIILTSHSMEECDELCGRLGIMVNGQFQCFGPTRYLKNKFGQGFTILAKLDTNGKSPEESLSIMRNFKTFVANKFKNCLVKDEHKDYVHFHVTDAKTPWSYLFSTMEEAKTVHPALSDYSVSETTLEQVFLSFAKNQRVDPRQKV